MFLADERRAAASLSAQCHLVEFMDTGRSGMAALLTVCGWQKLVDAKGVSRLYRSRIPAWTLVLLLVGCVLAVIVALAATPTGQAYLDVVGSWWDRFLFWLRGLF